MSKDEAIHLLRNADLVEESETLQKINNYYTI